jgi:hypothetical protein
MRPPHFGAARLPGIEQEQQDTPANTLKRRQNQEFLKRRFADASAKGDDQHATRLRRVHDRLMNGSAS